MTIHMSLDEFNDLSESALLLLGAVANERVTKHGGYYLYGRKVNSAIARLRKLGLVEDGEYVYHDANQFPDYSITELTAAGRAVVERAHPFEWRALCVHCGAALSRKEWTWPWAVKTLHGIEDECRQAPLVDGDPGPHAARRALSTNGPVEYDPNSEARAHSTEAIR